jgi:hypothetical protein
MMVPCTRWLQGSLPSSGEPILRPGPWGWAAFWLFGRAAIDGGSTELPESLRRWRPHLHASSAGALLLFWGEPHAGCGSLGSLTGSASAVISTADRARTVPQPAAAERSAGQGPHEWLSAACRNRSTHLHEARPYIFCSAWRFHRRTDAVVSARRAKPVARPVALASARLALRITG